MRSKRQVQQPPCGLNTGPTSERPGGFARAARRPLPKPLPVQFGQPSFEIVVTSVTVNPGSLYDANARAAQGSTEISRTCTSIDSTCTRRFRDFAPIPGAVRGRPNSRHGVGGGADAGDKRASISRLSLLRLVGRKIPSQLANEFGSSFAFSDRRGGRNKARREERTSGLRVQQRRGRST